MIDYACSLLALAIVYLALVRMLIGPRGRTDLIEVETPMSEGWMRRQGWR